MSDTLKLGRGFALPLEVVTEATGIVATRGAGKSSAGAVLVEETTAAGVPVVVIDWTGVFWGLRSNAKGDGPGLSMYVLGGPHGDVPLEASAGRFIADLVVDSGHSFVLDLSDFTKGEMRRFCADFLERLFERKARARTTLLLVIDEAHELAPQSPRGGFKGDAARLIGAMEQTVALGRSRGIGAVLITQRTQALNKAVLDLIETLVVMRMLSPRAVAAVRDWIVIKNEDDERGVLASLPELPTGTAWVWSPLRGILERIAVRRIRTFDSYATPKPGQVRVEPKARRELNLDALGEQMRATVERAKAEDPVELRKRIRELERQLAERPKAEPEICEIKIEVVPDAAIRSLEQLVKAASDTLNDLQGYESAQPVPRAPKVPKRAPVDRRSDPATPTRPDSVRSPGPAAQNGRGSDAQRRVLEALAWWEAAGVRPVSRLQLAMVAGYHPRTGSFAQALADLAKDGMVEFPQTGQVQALSRVLLGHAPATPTTQEALREMIYRQVGERRAELLRWIVETGEMTREQLADHVGVHPRTGSYAQALADLKALGLIRFPRKGALAPEDVMFL